MCSSRRRSSSRPLFLLLAAALAAGCVPAGGGAHAGAGGRHPWTIPGTLRVAVHAQPDTLQPLLTSDTTDKMIGRLIFDPLVSADAHGRTVPILAARVPTLANGDISSDGLTITYHLRHNIRWQDGVPFTSRDVAFSWHAIADPRTNVSSRAGYDLVRAVDTPDAYTAVFRLRRRFAPAVNTLFAESDTPMFIVPAHLLAHVRDINTDGFGAHPVGTGPFRLVRWVRDDRLELAANDRYFLGRPRLRAIIVRFVPDENTEVNQLRAHELDWVFEPSPQLYPALRGIDGVAMPVYDRNQVEEVLANMRSPLLADRRVRLAVAAAIDREAMVKKLTYGIAETADDEHPRFMWAHVGGFGAAYDPVRARSLLASAGWLPGDGGIVRRAGRPLRLTLVFNGSSATRRAAAVQVQAYLRAVGIDAPLRSVPLTQFAAPLAAGGVLAGGRYDLSLTGFVAGIDPDDSVRFACWSIPPGGDNYTRYCTGAMDAAQHAALEHYDERTRRRAYARVQALLHDDAPDTFLWWPRQMQALNTDVRGFAPNPVNEAWNAWEWSI